MLKSPEETKSENTKQASETDMKQMLESERKFKIIIIHVIMTLIKN